MSTFKKSTIIYLLLICCSSPGIAQMLTDGIITPLYVNSKIITATGGEVGVFPLDINSSLGAGFIEILLLQNILEENTIGVPEVVEITANSAIVRWEKIKDALFYSLFVYDKDGVELISNLTLDSDGQLKTEKEAVDFSLVDLKPDTEYYAEIMAYNNDRIINKQSLIIKTPDSPFGIEQLSDIKVYTINQSIIIETQSDYNLYIMNMNGHILVNKTIVLHHKEELPQGVYIVLLQNKNERRTYKVIVR